MTILRCPQCGDYLDLYPRATPFTEAQASALVALHISVAHLTAKGLMALVPPEETRTSE